MGDIHFDPDTHTYTYHEDGKALVVFAGVTQILSAAGLYGDTSYYNDYSRDRGRVVHKTIEFYHAGKLDPLDVDPVIEPYLDVWVAFRKDSKFVPNMHEVILHDPFIRVAGTADVIGTYEGRAAIIDIKTGAHNPVTGLQLAGYEYLYGKRCRRLAVHLKDTGHYSVIEYKDRHDRDVFLGAVAVHNWRKENLR